MAQEKTTTMADGNVSKVTALPGGCTLALFDSSGGVSKIDAQKFMELVRGSIQIGGRNLLPKTNQGATNWSVNTPYAKVCEEYVWPDGARGVHLKISDTTPSPADTYKMLMYSIGNAALLRLEPDTDYLLSMDVESLDNLRFQVRISQSTSRNQLTDASELITMAAGEHRRICFHLRTNNFSADIIDKQLICITQSSFGECHIRDLKLEKGCIATDWTPAPEDFGGGVKSPYTQSVTRLYLQQQLKPLTIQRKGGRHERRQNNTLRGCGQSTPETLDARRIVSPVRGCSRGTEKVGCASDGVSCIRLRYKRHFHPGILSAYSKRSEHTHIIQLLGSDNLSRETYLRCDDIYSHQRKPYIQARETCRRMEIVDLSGLHTRFVVPTADGKEVVAA